jgi:glycosyltransferase involved in cell wall biosynthesis
VNGVSVPSGQISMQDVPAVGSREPVRVLHLHAGNLYGGVETLLATLANLRHLCPSMESHFALCFEGQMSRELNSAHVPVHQLGQVRISRPWTVWSARHQLRKLLRRERYDAVICHQHWPLVVFGRTARAADQKVVLWAHNFHTGRNWLERVAQRIRPDLLIADSAFVGGTMSHLYPGVPAPVVYYPLPLVEAPDAPRWRAAAREKLEVDDATTVIIQVSRCEIRKGHLLHLKALARLKSRNWVCWIVGGPQNPSEQIYFDEVRGAAEQLGVLDRVRFLGQRSDVARLLAGADIFCQPNHGPEPFGIVYVEALWAGLPVVTTAMGGALEIVNESCGLLSEPDNPDSLAEALDQLIQSPVLRSRLGQAGPARARHLCDPAAQMQVLEELVRAFATGGPR